MRGPVNETPALPFDRRPRVLHSPTAVEARTFFAIVPIVLCACALDRGGTATGFTEPPAVDAVATDVTVTEDTDGVDASAIDVVPSPQDAQVDTAETAPDVAPEATADVGPETLPNDCTEQFRDGRRYVFCSRTTNWSLAQRFCIDRGLDLVVIEDEAENEFVASTIKSTSRELWWIGLTDQGSEGNFRWVGAKTPTYLNWGPEEPNNSGFGGEDCVAMLRATGKWNDLNCFVLAGGFVCEEI
jgi:hypothetical protein